MERKSNEEFLRGASATQSGVLNELWLFVRDNKKWWLIPVIVALLAFGLIIVLGGTAAAPFIYTLF